MMKTASTDRRVTWRSLLALETITLGTGGLTGYLIKDFMNFYDTLTKPAFAPPGWVFPVAWSILYADMAYAAWRIFRAKKPRRKAALVLYAIQLAVNLAWPWLFFVMHALGLSFLWLVMLWALILTLIAMYFTQDRMAGWLMIPYSAWVTFAGVLNFFAAKLNP